MEDGSVIIKCKGLDNKLLTEDDFKVLLSGKNINIETSKIFTSLKTGSGALKSMTFTIKPEVNNRRSINGEGPHKSTACGPLPRALVLDSVPYHVINGEVCEPAISSSTAA